jgi:hypothetical protein
MLLTNFFWALCRTAVISTTFFAGTLLGAADVSEKNGNVFYNSGSGATRQLTNLGKDYDPWLSCAGTTAVFVRKTSRNSSNDQLDGRNGSELWIAAVGGGNTARRVFGEDASNTKWEGLAGPLLSPDESTVFFLKWFGNGYSLYSAPVSGGTPIILVESVNRAWMVCDGRLKGSLVVGEDILKLAGGHTILYWLCDSAGHRVDLVGTTEEDVDLFLDGRTRVSR